jgi:preprotein translocase subunit YajC
MGLIFLYIIIQIQGKIRPKKQKTLEFLALGFQITTFGSV